MTPRHCLCHQIEKLVAVTKLDCFLTKFPHAKAVPDFPLLRCQTAKLCWPWIVVSIISQRNLNLIILSGSKHMCSLVSC